MPNGDFESGEFLVQAGLVTQEQLDKASIEAMKTKRTLFRVLEDTLVLSKEQIYTAWADRLGVVYVDLPNYRPDSRLAEILTEETCRRFGCFPLFKIDNTWVISLAEPTNIAVLDQLVMFTQGEVEPVLSAEPDIKEMLDRAFGRTHSAEELASPLAPFISGELKEGEFAEAVLGETEESPITKLVNLIISQAVRDGASDIHIEPEEDIMRIRFRIDGVLHEIPSPPKRLELAIISRVKVMSKMDIAESRVPQDGHFQMVVEGKRVDLRVSTLPTINGENLVLRLLDTSSVLLGLEQLGFSEQELPKFENMILRPYGIILVTGPTGSGKTTTLYAALNRINTIEKNIITIENPVEYRLGLIRQVEINPRAGITFANGLRAILRQDPNVIMVGEIRDLETAVIAVQAALTGHLVLSTLHTNDAPSAVTRLIDMGVEPFLISACLTGVIAQRLVRKVCTQCREPYKPDAYILKDPNLSKEKEVIFYRGKGCRICKGTGYKGRTGIFEIMLVSDQIKEMISQRATALEIKNKAQEEGMLVLRDDGIKKALKGISTLEEVLKVTEERVQVEPYIFKEEPQVLPAEKLETSKKELSTKEAMQIKSKEIESYKQKLQAWLSQKK